MKSSPTTLREEALEHSDLLSSGKGPVQISAPQIHESLQRAFSALSHTPGK